MKAMYLVTKMQYIAETTIPSIVTLSQLRTQTLSYQGTPRGNKVFLNIYFSFYFSHHHLFPSIYFITLKVFLILRLKSYLIYFLREYKVYLALVTIPSCLLSLWVQLQWYPKGRKKHIKYYKEWHKTGALTSTPI